jgi:16S rRNA (cytidine1402-2'-O)-methyltransferase
LLLQAAAAAAAGQHHPGATLYLVATPIGNLADFSLRAIHLLALADAVACEDTRVSGGLMRHLGLDKPLIALHEHNEREAAQRVLERLAHGERVAYVSDAGTPGVSDPGAVLVALVREAGHRVVPIPGASSVVAALSVAGDAGGPGRAGGHVFLGFLPAKGPDRAAALQALAAEARCAVVFEAPHRIEALATALAQACGPRPLTVCRELTKQFEQVATLPAAELPAWLAADAQRQRGEFVLVLHALPPADTSAEGSLPAAALRSLQVLLAANLPLKQAVALAAELSAAPRNALYAQALAWRNAPTELPDDA